MNKGFTLIEVMISIAIFIIGIGAVFMVASNLYTTNSFIMQQSMAIGEARTGIEIMMKEIREAKNGQDGSYVLEMANDYEFIFYSDIDNDQQTERVRYFLQNNNLKRGIVDPTGYPAQYILSTEKTSIISAYVRNLPPIFRYYDGNGFELPAPARLKDTKTMMLYIVINIDPLRPPQDFVLESYVQLRNLKTNL
jgi:prepilin-type N-terminal cleavage/methylation domain-containing protein